MRLMIRLPSPASSASVVTCRACGKSNAFLNPRCNSVLDVVTEYGLRFTPPLLPSAVPLTPAAPVNATHPGRYSHRRYVLRTSRTPAQGLRHKWPLKRTKRRSLSKGSAKNKPENPENALPQLKRADPTSLSLQIRPGKPLLCSTPPFSHHKHPPEFLSPDCSSSSITIHHATRKPLPGASHSKFNKGHKFSLSSRTYPPYPSRTLDTQISSASFFCDTRLQLSIPFFLSLAYLLTRVQLERSFRSYIRLPRTTTPLRNHGCPILKSHGQDLRIKGDASPDAGSRCRGQDHHSV